MLSAAPRRPAPAFFSNVFSSLRSYKVEEAVTRHLGLYGDVLLLAERAKHILFFYLSSESLPLRMNPQAETLNRAIETADTAILVLTSSAPS